MRSPAPLKPGDLIAITAPSAGVAAPMHGRLDAALAMLERRGYRLKLGECLRTNTQGESAPADARAAELMAFLSDPQVAAVMPPWGGNRAIELLPLIDFDALRAAPPKWLSGFSDLSTLILPLALRAGWCSVHGPNLMELAAEPLDTTSAAIWRFLEDSAQEQVQHASPRHQRGAAPDWSQQHRAGYSLDTPSAWRVFDRWAPPALEPANELPQEMVVEGRLLGGCLDVLSRLAGTPWADIRHWAQQQQEPTMIFLENAELGPHEYHRALWSLRLHDWFDRASAVLIGRHAPPDAPEGGFGFAQATRAAFADLKVPVICELDIGHVPPQLSIWMGAWGRLEISGSGAHLTQTRPSASA